MLLFLVTPYLVAAVQPCIEWIPIKEKKLAFLLLLIRSGCANYNAQGAFAVIFFISSDVSNALEVYMTYITVNYSCNFVQIIETEWWRIYQLFVEIVFKVSISACHFGKSWCRVTRATEIATLYRISAIWGPCFQTIFPFFMTMLLTKSFATTFGRLFQIVSSWFCHRYVWEVKCAP